MSNYKKDDIVVMNRDAGGCYEGESLTYVRPNESFPSRSVLKKIDGGFHNVNTNSFDLRDNPQFEFDELIEVSNHEDFELADEMYFVADISKMGKFDRPCNIVAMTDDGCIRIYPYARKITTVNLIIEGKTHKVTQEVRDAYVVALKAVMNDD